MTKDQIEKVREAIVAAKKLFPRIGEFFPNAIRTHKLCDEALQILDQMKPSEWQPIETAPRDGTEVLVCQENNHITFPRVAWSYDGESWCVWDDGYTSKYIYNMTHWQPLPAPPKEDK